MKVLVTGANGFVGEALCASLRARGIDYTAAVRRAEVGREDQWEVGNVNQDTDWMRALQGCDVVVHLAGQAHQPAGSSADALAALRATNVLGAVNLAHQAAAAGVKRFVFLSSIKAWGEITQPGCAARESDKCQPQDAYGHSKLEAEQALQQVARENAMQCVIIRPPLVYGPQVRANFALLVRAVLGGWPLPFGTVQNLRSFIALDNLVDFILLCARHPAAANQIFHVSDGVDLSIADLITRIALAADVQPRLLPVPVGLLRAIARLLGKTDVLQRLTENLQMDCHKANTVLGWSAPVSIDDGLRRVVSGLRQA